MMKKPKHPLRDYRFERNLSMSELARELKVCPAVLHKLEYNNGHKTVRRVLRYCRDHQVEPEIFFPPDA